VARACAKASCTVDRRPGARRARPPRPSTIPQRLWVRRAQSRSAHLQLFPKNRKASGPEAARNGLAAPWGAGAEHPDERPHGLPNQSFQPRHCCLYFLAGITGISGVFLERRLVLHLPILYIRLMTLALASLQTFVFSKRATSVHIFRTVCSQGNQECLSNLFPYHRPRKGARECRRGR
jgi:hypothetical protein